MLGHLVFFTFPDQAAADRGLAGLKPLEGIAAARYLRILPNRHLDAHGDGRSPVELVVFGLFDDAQALARYQADPVYAEAVRAVRPIRDMRVSAAIDLDAAGLIAALGGAMPAVGALPHSADGGAGRG